MVNRFRRTFYTPDTNYTPDVTQEFIPDLSGLEQVMSSLQAQFDATSKYDLPNYLRQSPTDKQAFNQYKANIEGYRQGAIDAFTSGDFSGGQSKLRGFGEYIRKSKMPEGDFFELERGVNEYNKALKDLQDTYLDPKSKLYQPEIYKYAKDKLDKGIPDYRDSLGNIRTGISGPQLDRYIPHDEVVKQLNDVLDNITADQVIIGGRVPRELQGLSFKQILERGEKKYIDYNKVNKVLSRIVTPEMMKSYNMLGEAMGLKTPQGQAMAYDENGKAIGFNTSTMLGNTLQGLADSKVFTQYNDRAQIISDDYGKDKALQSANILYSASEGKMQASPKFDMRNLKTSINELDSQIASLEGVQSSGGILTGNQLLQLDNLRTRRNILNTTKSQYTQSYLNTDKGKQDLSSRLEQESKGIGVAGTAGVRWLLNSGEVTKEQFEEYVRNPDTIPPNLKGLKIPAVAAGTSRGNAVGAGTEETNLQKLVQDYRNQFDREVTSYAKNNNIAMSSNVISAYTIGGNKDNNLAAGASNLLGDMVLTKGGAFMLHDENTTLDKFMEENNINQKDFDIQIGILDRRVGGENSYYFKATPKENYKGSKTNYEKYISPTYDLGLEQQLGVGLMQDALAKNGQGKYTEDPPLDLNQNSLNWTGNSWQVYDTGRRKYAESQLGDSFKEFMNLDDNNALVPNEDYDLYLPGMNTISNEPLSFRKEHTIKTDDKGRRFSADQYSIFIPDGQGKGVRIVENSISDLMLKLVQPVAVEQE